MRAPRRRWTALAIGAVALSAITAAALAAAAPARGAGCYSGRTFAAGDPHHVYAIPGGCTWLLKPDLGFFSIGPEFRTRIRGTDDGAALARDPLGEAAAACGFSTFVVRWPAFVVTARRVAWGDGTGCHDAPEPASSDVVGPVRLAPARRQTAVPLGARARSLVALTTR